MHTTTAWTKTSVIWIVRHLTLEQGVRIDWATAYSRTPCKDSRLEIHGHCDSISLVDNSQDASFGTSSLLAVRPCKSHRPRLDHRESLQVPLVVGAMGSHGADPSYQLIDSVARRDRDPRRRRATGNGQGIPGCKANAVDPSARP